MKSIPRTVIAVACIGVIAICLVLLSSRLVGRARLTDLTEQNLYSLSEGTRQILGGLDSPISLKLYYSSVAARKGPEQVRFWNNYYLYVRDLLEEYVNRSGGKLRLEVIDPRPFSDAAEDAIRHGVKRFNLPNDETFFFGLAGINEFGKSISIGFFEPQRQEFVEYDLSKLISALTQRAKRKVGLISPLPVSGGDMSPYMMQMLAAQGKSPPKPWTILQQLRQSYDVEAVDVTDAAIGKEIDFLLVIHPKDLDEPTRFAIDQYVMQGGKLLVFTDPHCLVDQPAGQDANPYAALGYASASGLNGLLRTWGVEMKPKAIAADRSIAVSGRFRRDGGVTALLPYLNLDERCVSKTAPATAELHSIQMLFAGVLVATGVAGADIQPLLHTTSVGNIWTPAGVYELRMPDPDQIGRQVRDGETPLMLACAIRGKLKSNFPDGIDLPAEAPPDEQTEAGDDASTKPAEKPTRHIPARAESAAGAAVVVVADVDMLTDRIAYRTTFFGISQVGDNASFVLNVLDWLAGEPALIRVRTRGRYNRPFKVVDEIEQQAARATAAEMDALNLKIRSYEAQLQQLGGANDKDIRLIHNEALEKRRQVEVEIRKANKQLRQLQARRREKVEALGWRLQAWNMAAAPSIILLIAVVLAASRRRRARRYAARRT